MARPTKVRGMDVTPSGGVKIQKVGAIYTRTLEEGGAIYFENGVHADTHTHILYRYCTLSDSLFYPLFSLPCLMQSSAAEELSMSWSQRYGAIARPHGSWVRSGQRTVAFHQSQHGDLTNQSRKKGDIVSNKWCYPLAMTNIAIEHDHL